MPLRSTTQPKRRNRQRAVCPVITSPCWEESCVCVCVCVPRTEVWVIQVRLKYEVEAGPDLIPSRSGVQTLRSAGLYRYQHVEVDSSLFVSERICGIPFLLSLSVNSELTAIKTFTGINLAQSLHVCKPWCKRVLVWYPLARLHGLKQKYFQHCYVSNCTELNWKHNVCVKN